MILPFVVTSTDGSLHVDCKTHALWPVCTDKLTVITHKFGRTFWEIRIRFITKPSCCKINGSCHNKNSSKYTTALPTMANPLLQFIKLSITSTALHNSFQQCCLWAGCETPQRSCVLCCTVVGTGSKALNPFIHHKAAKVYSKCCALCIVVSSLETLIARPSPQLSSLALQFTNSHSSHCREAMQSSDDSCGMRTVIVITWQSQYHCSIIIQPLTYLQFSQTLLVFS